MPASRASDVARLQAHLDRLSLHTAVESRSVPVPSTASKKKKAPNAFILFRSYAITERLLPRELTHQNDISREVALLWREQSAETRDYFQGLAEDTKRRMQLEGTIAEAPTRNRKKRVPAKRSFFRPPTSPEPCISIPSSTPELVHDSPKVVDSSSSPALLPWPLVEQEENLQIQDDQHFASSWTDDCESTNFKWMADELTTSLSLGSWCSSSTPFAMPHAPILDGVRIDWDAMLRFPQDAKPIDFTL